jgi:hypothetical protein
MRRSTQKAVASQILPLEGKYLPRTQSHEKRQPRKATVAEPKRGNRNHRLLWRGGGFVDHLANLRNCQYDRLIRRDNPVRYRQIENRFEVPPEMRYNTVRAHRFALQISGHEFTPELGYSLRAEIANKVR